MKNENENKKQEVTLNGVKISREQFEILKREFEKEVWKPWNGVGYSIGCNGEELLDRCLGEGDIRYGENFKAKELAEAVSKSRQLHNYLWQLKYDFDWDFVPDFENDENEKWNITFSHQNSGFTSDMWWQIEVVGVPVFSRKGAGLIVEKLNNKEIILPGFEVADE